VGPMYPAALAGAGMLWLQEKQAEEEARRKQAAEDEEEAERFRLAAQRKREKEEAVRHAEEVLREEKRRFQEAVRKQAEEAEASRKQAEEEEASRKQAEEEAVRAVWKQAEEKVASRKQAEEEEEAMRKQDRDAEQKESDDGLAHRRRWATVPFIGLGESQDWAEAVIGGRIGPPPPEDWNPSPGSPPLGWWAGWPPPASPTSSQSSLGFGPTPSPFSSPGSLPRRSGCLPWGDNFATSSNQSDHFMGDNSAAAPSSQSLQPVLQPVLGQGLSLAHYMGVPPQQPPGKPGKRRSCPLRRGPGPY
jgi:chemotaxis protein histidine kinase CheA